MTGAFTARLRHPFSATFKPNHAVFLPPFPFHARTLARRVPVPGLGLP